jgi:ankyrin repeat protein
VVRALVEAVTVRAAVALEKFPLHDAAEAGDAQLLERLLQRCGADAAREIERTTPDGYTALMLAAMSPRADAAIVQMLVEHGAAIHRGPAGPNAYATDSLTLALRAGDVGKVAALARAGADLRRCGQYTTLLDGLHGRDIRHDPRLLDLIRYLVERGVDIDFESPYRETALRVLSRAGRFDAVRMLLEAGADESQLAWTALIRAVAFGERAEVEALLASGAGLEETDWWQRTAWLVAITAGNKDIAKLLQDAGANVHATGRCREPQLFHAIHAHDLAMLRWLLEQGCDAAEVDEFGNNALMLAVEVDFPDAIEPLLGAGIDVNAKGTPYTALASTSHPEVARRLLEVGADPADITQEARRALVGLAPVANVRLLDVSPEEYRRGAHRRFGVANPERIDEPFWTAMIRAGVNAWAAKQQFREIPEIYPTWCAQRFGQSITFLQDGRVIQVGGEHEDGYDPDFCIYNDVFVHHPDGRIEIYGYPREVFPPTDFHTATLVGRRIFLIGSLGYQGQRRIDHTPVYALDIDDLHIERVDTTGQKPGWISRHRAELRDGEIVVSGGKRMIEVNGEEDYVDDTGRFALSLRTMCWRACT